MMQEELWTWHSAQFVHGGPYHVTIVVPRSAFHLFKELKLASLQTPTLNDRICFNSLTSSPKPCSPALNQQ